MLSEDSIHILKEVKVEQEENQKYCGNCYYKQEHAFVFLQENKNSLNHPKMHSQELLRAQSLINIRPAGSPMTKIL